MSKKSIWIRLLIPVLIMGFMISAVTLEKRGAARDPSTVLLDFLAGDALETPENEPGSPRTLVLYHAADIYEKKVGETICDTLDAMRVPYQTLDLGNEPDILFSQVSLILLASQSLHPFTAHLESLLEWIKKGGKLGLMMAPVLDASFRILYRNLGITEYGFDYYIFHSLRFTTGLLPLWGSSVFDEDLADYALFVRLEPDCVIHMESADSMKIPLLWERALGQGRIVVLNNTLLSGKDSRGIMTVALFALEDTLVYPIINAGMVFLDDFPAPQPEGYDPTLLAHYGYDIQGVFRNRWWPDMKSLARRFGLRYTGVLVETYNDTVEPPFLPESSDTTLIRYYAAELLSIGGEIGLHGYNHMPLTPTGFVYKDIPYLTWPSKEAMRGSIRELLRFGKQEIPSASYITYVPPSNYLSDEGLEALLDTVPELRVISGLYLSELGVNDYVQEFREEANGTISVPRVSSGFVGDRYDRFVMAEELLLHGVFSHFIHPDDILDESRGAALGWDEMLRSFTQLLESITATYPELRFSTAGEGAAAVQRYERLRLMRNIGPDSLEIRLMNLYDTAWLALRTREKVLGIEGGELFPISENFFWIRADGPEVTIHWERGL